MLAAVIPKIDFYKEYFTKGLILISALFSVFVDDLARGLSAASVSL